MKRAPHFNSTFHKLRHICELNTTETRRNNLAEKRHEKRSHGPATSSTEHERVGPDQTSPTPEETKRIASISDPSNSSAGSRLFAATHERESENLPTSFCQTVLDMLFPDTASVIWAIGRNDGMPILEWRDRCNSFADQLTA